MTAGMGIRFGDHVTTAGGITGTVVTKGAKYQLTTPDGATVFVDPTDIATVQPADPPPTPDTTQKRVKTARRALVIFARRLRDRTNGQRSEEAVLLHALADSYLASVGEP